MIWNRQPMQVRADVHVTNSSTTTVVEKRAPTDESVRLLKEMETAARDKVEAAVRVGGNGFEAVVQFHRDHLSDATIAVALYKLNGRQMRSEASVSGRAQPTDLIAALRDVMAKDIAAAILMPALAAAQIPTPRIA
jgi:hypothetical protein